MSENNEDTHNGENFTAFTSPNYVSPVPELGQVGHETSTGERESVLEKLRDPNYLPSSQDIFLAFGRNLGRKFQEFCFDDEHPVYEFLNSEHLTALSDYFALRSSDLGATSEKPLIILEVGAGNGRLSHFLREKLGEDEKGLVEVIATDANVSKDTNPYGISPVFPVEHITTDEALRQFNPDIVICSWMPYRADWTPVFRATKSVKEYVLLG